MKKGQDTSDFIERRGELLAELFLQDMEPFFLARSTIDVGYDFLVGFSNKHGGINNYAVEVKETDQSVASTFPIAAAHYERLANSNIPAMLLVVDVKQNRLFYAWITPDSAAGRSRIPVPVIEITDTVKQELRQQFLCGQETKFVAQQMNLQQAKPSAHP